MGRGLLATLLCLCTSMPHAVAGEAGGSFRMPPTTLPPSFSNASVLSLRDNVTPVPNQTGAASDTAVATVLDKESLERDWEWVREETTEWQWKDGVLWLRTQPGGVWGGNEPARNVLVTKSVIEGTGSVEALVGLENPIRKYEQAGLLVYRDDANFVKLIVEFIDDSLYVVMARELDNRGEVVAKVETGLQEAWLRYEVNGNEVRGLWRADAESEWTEAAVCAFPEDLDGRFAIFTQSGPEEEVRWATVKGVTTITQGLGKP